MVKIEHRKNRFPRHSLAVKAGVETVFFMSDISRGVDSLAVLEHLPKGSHIIFRDYDMPDRERVAHDLRKATFKNRQYLLIAGDVNLASRVGADGIHLPEHVLKKRRKKLNFPIITAACHNSAAIKRALDVGVDYIMLSPIFLTGSHPGAKLLGIHRLTRLMGGQRVNYVALGGVNARTAPKLRGLKNINGIAAIEGLAV